MSSTKNESHIPVPKNTPAFFCADCGAVALDQNNICKAQGRGTKADWCGSQNAGTPLGCHNKVHNLRYRCNNCGQVAVNPELLCEPVKMDTDK